MQRPLYLHAEIRVRLCVAEDLLRAQQSIQQRKDQYFSDCRDSVSSLRLLTTRLGQLRRDTIGFASTWPTSDPRLELSWKLSIINQRISKTSDKRIGLAQSLLHGPFGKFGSVEFNCIRRRDPNKKPLAQCSSAMTETRPNLRV